MNYSSKQRQPSRVFSLSIYLDVYDLYPETDKHWPHILRQWFRGSSSDCPKWAQQSRRIWLSAENDETLYSRWDKMAKSGFAIRHFSLIFSVPELVVGRAEDCRGKLSSLLCSCQLWQFCLMSVGTALYNLKSSSFVFTSNIRRSSHFPESKRT